MKQTLHYEKIRGYDCVMFVNKSGGMWFGIIDGKPYGAHETYENGSNAKEHIKFFKQQAVETINSLKALQK